MSTVSQLVPEVVRPHNNNVSLYNRPVIVGTLCPTFNYNYDPVSTVIFAMYILFGIVYALFGYRCFKASMFLTGFTFGTGIVYMICLQEHLMPPYGNVCVALCAGVLFGLITMLIQYVGLFMTGFHTGLLVAVAGLAVYDNFLDYRPTSYLSAFNFWWNGLNQQPLNNVCRYNINNMLPHISPQDSLRPILF